MKLIDLDPRWLERDGQRVGIVFRCPCCAGPNPARSPIRLSCFFVATPFDAQLALFDAVFGEDEMIAPCGEANVWSRIGDDFASLTITPSIDASAAGHWHGFVTLGQVNLP